VTADTPASNDSFVYMIFITVRCTNKVPLDILQILATFCVHY